MTAQQQLAELIAGRYMFAEAWENWGKDHGPAIAELIEAAKAKQFDLDSDDAINAALRKLTQGT